MKRGTTAGESCFRESKIERAETLSSLEREYVILSYIFDFQLTKCEIYKHLKLIVGLFDMTSYTDLSSKNAYALFHF